MISSLDKLECTDKFNNLGGTMGAEGEEAWRARVCCARAKFTELVPVLMSMGASLKVKGKTYGPVFSQ